MGLKIVAYGMPRPFAEEIIHRLGGRGDYGWEASFTQKLRVRGYSMRQVIETLKGGSINQGPELDEYGEWRCRIKRRVAGRLVRVVVAIRDERWLTLLSVH